MKRSKPERDQNSWFFRQGERLASAMTFRSRAATCRSRRLYGSLPGVLGRRLTWQRQHPTNPLTTEGMSSRFDKDVSVRIQIRPTPLAQG